MICLILMKLENMFIDGLKVLVVGIVYAIPIWIIAAIIGTYY